MKFMRNTRYISHVREISISLRPSEVSMQITSRVIYLILVCYTAWSPIANPTSSKSWWPNYSGYLFTSDANGARLVGAGWASGDAGRQTSSPSIIITIMMGGWRPGSGELNAIIHLPLHPPPSVIYHPDTSSYCILTYIFTGLWISHNILLI